MTTIEQLKLQKKTCEDLGLRTDVEKLQKRIAKLENNLSDERLPALVSSSEITDPSAVDIVEAQETQVEYTIKTIAELTESEREEFENMNIDPADVARSNTNSA